MGHAGTIGIVGGGQLGRMLTLAAKPLGYSVVVLDPSDTCPAAQVGAEVITGDLYDAAAIAQLAERVDVVTVEIEHLNTDALADIAAAGVPVHPAPQTIKLIQDKYQQKVFLRDHDIAVPEFAKVDSVQEAHTVLDSFGGSMILKARHGAYDGRGNAVVSAVHELPAAWSRLGGKHLYAEKLVDFDKELSVVVARDRASAVRLYDVVEMAHERNICLEVIAPAQISSTAAQRARTLAKQVAAQLQGAGVFAIEMFLTKTGDVLVNEIAPRVHNSGHHTIESCVTSQFEQHIRAVAGLPLGDVSLRSPAVMVNILGTQDGRPSLDMSDVLRDGHVYVHWYGKAPIKIDRKMGHITAIGGTVQQAKTKARRARKKLAI
jgi:phosphoribosylaminoimidazole carboxylase PurK protein